MMGSQTLSVVLDDELVTFTRAVGVLRRRNFPIKSVALGPSASPGLARLTIMMQTDPTTANRAARQLEKVVGVHQAAVFPDRDGVARELALIRVRADQERYAELLELALLYKATVVDESADGAILEVSGSEAFIGSFLRALAAFEVVDVARSGAVFLERASVAAPPLPSTAEAVP
jgi:acetolactate synthase I/III small subunit